MTTGNISINCEYHPFTKKNEDTDNARNMNKTRISILSW